MSRLVVDDAGLSALASTLTGSASDSDSASQSADAALSSLAGAASSSPLAGALADLADRYRGQSARHAQYLNELGKALARIGVVFDETDSTVAAASRVLAR